MTLDSIFNSCDDLILLPHFPWARAIFSCPRQLIRFKCLSVRPTQILGPLQMCGFGNKERLYFGDLLRVFLWVYISQTLPWLSDAPLFRNDGRKTLRDFSNHLACGITVGWQKQSIVWTLSYAKIFDRFPRILDICFVSTLLLSQWPELFFQHNKRSCFPLARRL